MPSPGETRGAPSGQPGQSAQRIATPRRRSLVAQLLVGLICAGLVAVCFLAPGVPVVVRLVVAMLIVAAAVITVRVVRGDIPLLPESGSELVAEVIDMPLPDAVADYLDGWLGEPMPDEPPVPCWRCGRLNASEAAECTECHASIM